MLSYNSADAEIAVKIRHILQNIRISVWPDERKDMKDNMYDRLANGVENAAVVCCFLTSDYENCQICKLELQYAHKRRKPIIPFVLSDTRPWKTFSWLESIIDNCQLFNIDGKPESNDQSQAEEFINYMNRQLSISKYLESQPVNQPSYLFELIKYEYIRNSRIERFMNPSKSFPIEQSYINLTIIETEEQREKEKKLRNTEHSNAINSTFEEIYGTKTPIDVKDIFEKCKDKSKQVLVFGRSGIGKSTFCRYVAYQWATGMIWP
ncbi:unnamed protein product [Rotaria sp. Silwood1]|nr:unnamed protein product [Rotaria sp. Silwood1]